MKAKLTFLICTFFFWGCVSVRNSAVTTGKSQKIANMVNPDFEKIDPGILQIIDKRFVRKDSLKIGGNLPRKYDTVLNLSDEKITIRDNKHLIVKTIRFEIAGSEHTLWEFLTPYLFIYKTFYENGNIKSKGAGSDLGFQIGKGYWFNEKGKLKKNNDSDIGYNFNFDDVLLFCDKNEISLLQKNDRETRRKVEKRKYKGMPAWFITAFYPKDKKWLTLILAGKTGQILGTVPMPIILE